MNEQNVHQEVFDSDGRESSLSDGSADALDHHNNYQNHHSQQVRVLGEPLSDRSSSQSNRSGSGGHRPPALLIDAESQQAIDGYQTEEDSLQFFEEQEKQIALQLAQENIGKEEDEQHLAEEEEDEVREMMSRIEEEEDSDKEEEEMEEKEEGRENEEEEEENNGQNLPTKSRISIEEEEEPPRSSYSHISESLQNREFPGADLLSHPEQLDEQQKSNSTSSLTEGYLIGYPTDPPPAYSSPRKERPGTSSREDPGRYPVPAPYSMTLTNDEHKVRDIAAAEELVSAEGTSGATNVRSAIGDSLTLAGGMAAAVLAAPPVADNPSSSKRSPFSSPRSIGHGVDSPRGDGQRQNAGAKVVHGARTVAELQQQRGKTAQEKDGDKTETQQQKRKDSVAADGQLHFPISGELKALFGQIEDYVAERVEIVPNWKPFQIEYIPAVGEVDPFIKNDELLLGLAVLDEPATLQSDSAIVDLRLHQMAGNSAADVPVKKLSRADKNTHQIDRWVVNVKELRRTKAPMRVVYRKPMPSIESLMQEWPTEVEQKLKDMKLLISANLDADLEDFVDLCLGLVDIPVHKSRLESLHVLFSLYAEFRASQHFRNMALDRDGADRAPSTNIDQFVVPD